MEFEFDERNLNLTNVTLRDNLFRRADRSSQKKKGGG